MKVFSPVVLAVLCMLVAGGNSKKRRAREIESHLAIPNDLEAEMVEGMPNEAETVEEDQTENEKAWANDFDEDMRFECPRKGAIYKVESEHSWSREDRRWLFECADVVTQASGLRCAWTKDTEVNEFDHPFYYECPVNQYLAGVASIHSHKKEDRQWSYKCCGSQMLSTDSCVLSEFVNWFGGALTYSAPEGHVMVGAGSINKNRMEDRIWKFSTCQYANN